MAQNRQKQVILPTVITCNFDLTKNWYVRFSYRDATTDKLKVFKKYTGINTHKTVEERLAAARALMYEYTAKLKNGWSPFDNEKVIYEDSLEYEVVAEKYGKLKRGFTPLRTLMNEYLKQFERHSHGTYQTYKSKLRTFAKFLQRKDMDTLHPAVFTEKEAKAFFAYLLDNKKLSNKTHNQYRILFHSFFQFLIEKKKIKHNPISSIKLLPEEKVVPKYYNEGMIHRIKAYIEKNDPQLWLSVRFQYYCFIRPKEQRFLQVKHLDLWAGKIRIPAAIGKNNKDRTVTIPQVFWNELLELELDQYDPEFYVFSTNRVPDAKPVGKNYFYNHYQKVIKALNIPKGYMFYNWKHTGAAMAALEGINMESLRQQLGHHSLDQVKEYIESMVGDSTKEFRDKHKAI